MCDTRLTRLKSLHRVNSGGEDFDSASEYIGGNINIAEIVVEPTIKEEEDILSDDEEADFVTKDLQSLTIEDYVTVNKLLPQPNSTQPKVG